MISEIRVSARHHLDCACHHSIVFLVLCFDLITPPMLEQEDFNREITGDEKQDSKKYRRRVGSLHPGHALISPYCHHLRIVLYQSEDLDNFENLCKIAGLQR